MSVALELPADLLSIVGLEWLVAARVGSKAEGSENFGQDALDKLFCSL